MIRKGRKVLYFLIGIVIVLLIFLCWPLPEDIFKRKGAWCIFDRNEKIIWLSVNKQGQYQIFYDKPIPENLRQSTILFEDEYFYYHPGINPVSTIKAIRDYFLGKKLRGSSTLTMQCARIYYGNKKRTIFQKWKEILLALRWEWQQDKEEILRWYLNHAPYGKNFIGMYVSSILYFNKTPSELSIAESALLAVLPNDPGRMYPGKNNTSLLKKRNNLLFKLYRKGKIKRQEWIEALCEPIPQGYNKVPDDVLHLFDFIKSKFPEPVQIKTTIDYSVQEKIQQLVNQQLTFMMPAGVNNAAVLVIELPEGVVRSYVGNGDFILKNPDFWVDIIQAKRSTGSTLKPFLFSCALEKKLIYPQSWLKDVPEYFGTYDPSNASGSYDGVVSASEALDRSLNVPFVDLLRKTGIPVFYEKLKTTGIQCLNKPVSYYGLSLILGGADCSMWELVTAYLNLYSSAMNLKKKFAEPGIIMDENITNEKENVFDPGAAQAAIQSLSCLKSSVEQSRNPELIYYKTGTSYGFRDAWAVGMNGAYLVCVWIGNSDGKGIKGLTGREAAVPLMKKVFDALGNGKRFSFPYGFKDKTMLCSETGYEAGEYCEKKVVALVPRCAIPAPICPYHKKILTDSAQQFRYHTQCAPHYAKEKIMLVMEPVQELYYKLKNPTFVSVPPLHPDCLTSEKETEFQILYPREGLQLDFPDGKNEIICKVTHRNKKARLKWYMDDSLVAQTTGIHQISVSLKSGKHKLSVMDSEGNAENVCFEITE